MNVLNRGMFKNRDSRNRLAQMGGILSSSPELQETAMTFANGGGADLPDYIINVPGLTAEGEYLRISSATLEKLNNAVPEVMANARMVSPVDMVISEGFSSLVANARPGDAVVGTRVNRLREQRATETDPSRVPMPPEIPQGSSAAEVFAGATRNNLRNPNTTPYSETDQRIKADEVRRAEAALLESLAPNNAQGQPGGTLGKRYAESDDDLRMINSQKYIESLIKGDPFSGELSPSQTARNQETLSNTLRREEIAQQRADIAESGRIAQDAADTRKAFSVPLEEPPMFEASEGKFFKDGTTSLSAEETARLRDLNIRLSEEDRAMAADFPQPSKPFPPYTELGPALESGIAKAVPTEVDDAAERLIRAERLKVLKLQALNKMQEPTVTPAEELQSVTDGGSRAAPTPMPDVEAERLLQAERERVLKLQALNKMQEPTVSSAEELQGSGEEGSIFDTAGDYITEFFLNPEIQEKINSAIKQSQEATAAAVQKRVGPAIAASEDAVQALGNEAAIDAMNARNEAGSYRIAGKGFTGDGSEVDVKIEADPEGAGTVSADPLKAVVPIAKTATEVAAAMAGLGPDVLGDDVKGVSKSVGDADQQLAEEQVSAQAAAESEKPTETPDATASEKVLAAIEAQPEPDSDADEIFKEGVSSSVTTEIKQAAVDAGMGKAFGGDGSIKALTEDYTKLLKSLLGESDEDKAARKGELFMLMGAALMSGKSSNALTNIGGALQIGAKAAIQDRATRKKREDTIGLKGFELAADRIAKRDAAQLVLDKEGRAEQRRLKAVAAQNKERRAFETWKLSQKKYFGSAPYKAVDANFKALLKAGRDSATIDLVSGEKPRDYALRKLSELFEPDNIALYLSTINALPAGTDGGGGQTDGGGFKIGD